MISFLHKLFNPHCEHCKEEKVCQTCEVLKTQLEIERHEKEKLLRTVLQLTNPEPRVEMESNDEIKIIRPRMVPWRVKQQILEQEDRAKAEIIRRNKDQEEEAKKLNKANESLEKELGIG